MGWKTFCHIKGLLGIVSENQLQVHDILSCPKLTPKRARSGRTTEFLTCIPDPILPWTQPVSFLPFPLTPKRHGSGGHTHHTLLLPLHCLRFPKSIRHSRVAKEFLLLQCCFFQPRIRKEGKLKNSQGISLVELSGLGTNEFRPLISFKT